MSTRPAMNRLLLAGAAFALILSTVSCTGSGAPPAPTNPPAQPTATPSLSGTSPITTTSQVSITVPAPTFEAVAPATPVPQPTVATPAPTKAAVASPAPTEAKPQTDQAGTKDNPEVALAIKDLATRAGVAESDVVVVSSEAVDWPDSSLGCPQEGDMYAQVITPGHKVVLEAGGKTYEYHTARGQAVYCEQ